MMKIAKNSIDVFRQLCYNFYKVWIVRDCCDGKGTEKICKSVR